MMLNIEYNDWKIIVDNLLEKHKSGDYNYLPYYLQTYFLNKDFLEKVKDKSFFDENIKNNKCFLDRKNYFLLKNPTSRDGILRSRFFISPIFYLIYLCIGYKIDKNKKIKISKNTFYAGDFSNGDYHYKNSWNEFCKEINKVKEEYKKDGYCFYYDIKNFFDSINFDILFDKIILQNIEDNFKKEYEEEKDFYKDFLKYIGQGKFPQTEEGTTSSFFSILYLLEIDERISLFMKNYKFIIGNPDITDIKIIRYVDDCYIFFKYSDDTKVGDFLNELFLLINNKLFDINLTINKNKTKIYKKEKIEEIDLKKFVYDSEGDKDYEKFNINSFNNFIAQHKTIKYNEEYEKEIMYLNDYIIGYKKHCHTKEENNTLKEIQKTLLKDDKIFYNPVQFTKLFLLFNDKEAEVYKRYLEKVFCELEKDNYYAYISGVIYLVLRSFEKIDLKNKIKNMGEIKKEKVELEDLKNIGKIEDINIDDKLVKDNVVKNFFDFMISDSDNDMVKYLKYFICIIKVKNEKEGDTHEGKKTIKHLLNITDNSYEDGLIQELYYRRNALCHIKVGDTSGRQEEIEEKSNYELIKQVEEKFLQNTKISLQ